MEDARIAFHAAILPSHIDMIIDSGASDVLFPGKDESACTDVQLVDGILTIGDKSQVPTYATAKYGILNPVILCHSLMYALVAVSFLTNQSVKALRVLHRQFSLYLKKSPRYR